MKTVLCYGDSNTWGANPRGDERFGPHERWAGRLRTELGEAYWVVEEGLCGRTTVWDDPLEDDRNGERYLRPCLDSHRPDLVILLLGTNDLKHRFGLSPYDIACGAGKLADIIRGMTWYGSPAGIEVLLVCPPPIIEAGFFGQMFAGGAEKSLRLPAHYQAAARDSGCHFLDAGAVISSCPGEGIHWEAAEHRRLATVLAAKVRSILENGGEKP